jgi:hypothetical protein
MLAVSYRAHLLHHSVPARRVRFAARISRAGPRERIITWSKLSNRAITWTLKEVKWILSAARRSSQEQQKPTIEPYTEF